MHQGMNIVTAAMMEENLGTVTAVATIVEAMGTAVIAGSPAAVTATADTDTTVTSIVAMATAGTVIMDTGPNAATVEVTVAVADTPALVPSIRCLFNQWLGSDG